MTVPPGPVGYTIGPCIGGRPGITLVFAARDPSGDPCAIKTLHPDVLPGSVSAARFAREVETHVACADISGIVSARVADADGRWLMTDWAHGGDLANACERSAAVRIRTAQCAPELIASLLRTLATMHERGFVHRDIKPSNLLVDAESIWLTDFGIAGMRETIGRTEHWRALPPPWRETRVGTPPWAAPELSLNPPLVTPASDIYSAARLWQWMREQAELPETSSREQELIAWMTKPDPAARPSAESVITALP